MSEKPEKSNTRDVQGKPKGKIVLHEDMILHETQGDVTKDYSEINDGSISPTGEIDVKKRQELARKKLKPEW